MVKMASTSTIARNRFIDTLIIHILPQSIARWLWYVAERSRFPRRGPASQLFMEAHADNVPWVCLDQVGAGAAVVIAARGIGTPGADGIFPWSAVGGVPRLLLELRKLSDQKPGILVAMVRHCEHIVVDSEGSQVLPLHQAASSAILSFLLYDLEIKLHRVVSEQFLLEQEKFIHKLTTNLCISGNRLVKAGTIRRA
ncbi:MAG: hypothetical protein SOY30_10850 [Eubacteriales bacterium]|nr:hypothetical protein [Eubacteriales bacterium]